MKLRNKKTGEIVEAHEIDLIDKYVYLKIFRAGDYDTKQYTSLAGLNAEWCDAPEEPKKFWYIDTFDCKIEQASLEESKQIGEFNKSIGNWLETEEETERAVERLQAWTRLKDKGFKFDFWGYDGGNYLEKIRTGRILFRVKDYEENDKDLDLLFSREDN